ncbi:unnamed protein product [Urochloa humidicola]
MEAAWLDGHPWSSLKDLYLMACAFNGPDLSKTINDLRGLKTLSIRSCPLTDECSENGLCIESPSLAMVELWSCTADRKVTIGRAPGLIRLILGVVPAPEAAAAPPPPVQIEVMYCSNLNILGQLDMRQQNITFGSEYKITVHYQRVLILPYVHTLSVAVEMDTAHHASDLLSLPRFFPNLKNLSLQRVDNGTGDGVCPPIDSARCLVYSLQCLTMQQFRGSNVETTFVTAVLATARFLVSLVVELHPKTQLEWHDATSFFLTCDRVSRQCDILVFQYGFPTTVCCNTLYPVAVVASRFALVNYTSSARCFCLVR